MDRTNFRLAIELRDALLAELRVNPNFLAYEHVQAAIVALAKNKDVEQLTPSEPAVSERNGRQSFKSGSQSEAILTATVTYLREKKARAQSAEILSVLTDKGIVVGGRKPRSTLASYLSHSALFDNVRNEG